ncbi:MAG TPA: copper homeostasis protein CutC [Candidatus Acidoferrum sp.]|nr:copper homeostasis protein CutC [Candidatus Acidoferrum sp.]
MTPKYLLEISVDSVEKAVAAEPGGADRIELCADLSVGGLTPSREQLRAVREKVHIPVYSMIRPRAGDFVYSNAEFAEMEHSIAVATECGMDGVVLGVLKKNRHVDMARTRRLVDLARPLPVTFHRAFDETPNLSRALEAVIQTGAARILTSAGAKTALQGAAKLAELVAAARDRVSGVGNPMQPDRIIIVPGAGITESNIAEVVRKTGAIEFHAGLGSVLPYSTRDFAAFESEVRKLGEALKRLQVKL